MTALLSNRAATTAPDYLCRRVVDAFLREDVRGCLSRGTIVTGAAPAFAEMLPADLADGSWLRITFDADEAAPPALWLAVEPCRFMQPWRLRALPAVRVSEPGATLLTALPDILACFRHGLDDAAATLHDRYAEECQVAARHRALCEAERQRWFARPGQGAPAADAWPGWARSLLHHDRLASFHDHPFYPTARAKVGFSDDDLRAYAPEFQPRFRLHWLAVPRALFRGAALPDPVRPDFAAVGLNPALADDHVLLPVHPALWHGALPALLAESGLADRVVPAPQPWLEVTPTLSVRTVAPVDVPALHIKLPLIMRTLGQRNLRTIKPGTIADGATVHRILGAIAAADAGIGRVLTLTDEEGGGAVDDRPFLAFILRRYDDAALGNADVVPVAALPARDADGRLTLCRLADRHFGGDLPGFFQHYLALTLDLHLTLWLRYGIALESNQQNSMLVLPAAGGSGAPLSLLLKDNDGARLHGRRLTARRPDLAPQIDSIRDRRLVVDDESALARMFITITLQLNIAALIEAMAAERLAEATPLYAATRTMIDDVLDRLAAAGDDVAPARAALLTPDRLPLKYLMRAASLDSPAGTAGSTAGTTDVNKFYGVTAPNFLKRS